MGSLATPVEGLHTRGCQVQPPGFSLSLWVGTYLVLGGGSVEGGHCGSDGPGSGVVAAGDLSWGWG